MFDVSVTDASQACLEMLEVLTDVNEEFQALRDRIDARADVLTESKREKRTRIGKRLRVVRQIQSDLEEFSEDISIVTKDLGESHDRLIQTLGDVLLSCDIDSESQMKSFRALMKGIRDSCNLVDALIRMSAKVSDSWSQESMVPRSTTRTINDLTQELVRVRSVYTRMIHLAEYFS